MPAGYPYNIESNYPVPMVTDDGKMAMPQSMVKEERLKESPSPNENPKNQSQVNALSHARRKGSETHSARSFADNANQNDQN